MSNNDTIRDVRHVKAARELLRWSQPKLATAADLSVASVRRFETGTGTVSAGIEAAIMEALTKAGVVFVEAGMIADVDAAAGILLRTSARPEEPTGKKIYVYGAAKPAGRPVGRKETSPRKARGDVPAGKGTRATSDIADK